MREFLRIIMYSETDLRKAKYDLTKLSLTRQRALDLYQVVIDQTLQFPIWKSLPSLNDRLGIVHYSDFICCHLALT